jgi:hypothetical protein
VEGKGFFLVTNEHPISNTEYPTDEGKKRRTHPTVGINYFLLKEKRQFELNIIQNHGYG